ncbi:MAG: nucleotidyltransferase domain-containing protein [Bacteroidetes bacterium]|nr:nucleotidyltransferase domain-containing protein [Bacteroidota bacterium]
MNVKSNISYLRTVLQPEVLDYLKRELYELLKDRLKQLILFGSYARGKFNDESDVDFLLVTSTKLTTEEKEKITEIELNVLSQYKLFITIIPELEEFVTNYSWLPFYRNIEKEGILLYG